MHQHTKPTALASFPLSSAHRLKFRSFRDAHQQFWIEGIRHFVQACDANLQFSAIILCPILLRSDLVDKLARKLRVGGVPCLRVTPEQFRAVSTTERASGIAAIAKQPWAPLDALDLTTGIGVAVAEQIRSPGNLGTILRTAEAVGITAMIFVGAHCDPFDPAVVRASMGAIAHLPLVRTSSDRLARWLLARDIHLIGLTPDAERLWTDLPPAPRLGLALGEERRGLSPTLHAMCRLSVRLPMTGKADSLNVGVAAGVMMYELLRRQPRQPSS